MCSWLSAVCANCLGRLPTIRNILLQLIHPVICSHCYFFATLPSHTGLQKSTCGFSPIVSLFYTVKQWSHLNLKYLPIFWLTSILFLKEIFLIICHLVMWIGLPWNTWFFLLWLVGKQFINQLFIICVPWCLCVAQMNHKGF